MRDYSRALAFSPDGSLLAAAAADFPDVHDGVAVAAAAGVGRAPAEAHRIQRRVTSEKGLL
jgi:hypothetical protein